MEFDLRESASSPLCDITLASLRLRSATAATMAPTDCGLWRVRSLRLRCSCLCVWAFDYTATPNTADCLARSARDSELSAPLHFAPHGAGDRRVISPAVNFSTATVPVRKHPIRHRLCSDSVPVAETSETRERRISLRSHALPRVSSKCKCEQTMRPRRVWAALRSALAVMKVLAHGHSAHFVARHGGRPQGLLVRLQAQERLCGVPPHGRNPLAQAPRPWVPAGSSRVTRVRSARFTAHNRVLCTQTRCVVTRLAPAHVESAGDTAEPCANSPPHPSRQRACHCALFVQSRGVAEQLHRNGELCFHESLETKGHSETNSARLRSRRLAYQ
jgi:hypothetical protein